MTSTCMACSIRFLHRTVNTKRHTRLEKQLKKTKGFSLVDFSRLSRFDTGTYNPSRFHGTAKYKDIPHCTKKYFQ